jgi:hypothetical protein
MSTEEIPKWVAEEIKNAKFDHEEEWSGSGYILDVNKEARKIDVQFYEKLPEGRYIATLDLPESIDPNSLELAVVYLFRFKAFRASLNPKVVSFLKEKYSVNMDSIYRFELKSFEKMGDEGQEERTTGLEATPKDASGEEEEEEEEERDE